MAICVINIQTSWEMERQKEQFDHCRMVVKVGTMMKPLPSLTRVAKCTKEVGYLFNSWLSPYDQASGMIYTCSQYTKMEYDFTGGWLTQWRWGTADSLSIMKYAQCRLGRLGGRFPPYQESCGITNTGLKPAQKSTSHLACPIWLHILQTTAPHCWFSYLFSEVLFSM